MIPDREFLTIVDNIQKNVASKKWPCLAFGCTNLAIASHLLQRNGVLSSIAENEHVYEFRVKQPFQMKPGDLSEIKLMGIRKAFTQPLFCNGHDNALFKAIEEEPVQLNEYKSQLLFSYRSVCSELRKKEKMKCIEERIRDSKTMGGRVNRELSDSLLHGLNLGIADMQRLKEEIEKDLDHGTRSFNFETFSYPHNWCLRLCPLQSARSVNKCLSEGPLLLRNR